MMMMMMMMMMIHTVSVIGQMFHPDIMRTNERQVINGVYAVLKLLYLNHGEVKSLQVL